MVKAMAGESDNNEEIARSRVVPLAIQKMIAAGKGKELPDDDTPQEEADLAKIFPVSAQAAREKVEAAQCRAATPEIGNKTEDGWVIGGISPETNKVFSIEPVDSVLDGYKTWHEGKDHASVLRDQNHENARQPADSELKIMYNNIVAGGKNDEARFNTSGSNPYGQYWSSTPHPNSSDSARIQYFDGGGRGWYYKDDAYARVRCVRDEPGLTL